MKLNLHHRTRKSAVGRCLALTALLSLVACGDAAHAQTSGVWTGSSTVSGNFSDSNNWVGAVPNAGANVTLTFGLTMQTTILNQDLGLTFTLNKLSFAGNRPGAGDVLSSFTLNGGAFSFVGSGAEIRISSNNPSGAVQTINNQILISTSNGLQFIGSTSTGTFAVNGGIANNTDTNAVLTLRGGTGLNVIDGLISDVSGTLSIFKTENGLWRLTNSNNSFRGNVTAGNGQLQFDSVGALGLGNTITILGDGGLNYVGSGPTTIMNKDLFISGDAASLIAGAGLTITGGNVTSDTATRVLSFDGGSGVMGNLITGEINLYNDNGSSWIFTNNNTYSGWTHLENGTFEVAADHALGTGTLKLPGGTTIRSHGNYTLSNSTVEFTSAGSVTLTGSGSLYFTSSNNNPSAATNIVNQLVGGLTLSGRLLANTTLTIGGIGAANLLGGVTIADTRIFTLRGDANGVTSTVASLSGGITTAFIKTGSGTVVLSNPGSFSGSVTIRGGALQIGTYADYFSNSALTLTGTGVLQASGSLTASLGSGVGQITWTGNAGFGAAGGNLVVNLGNASQTLVWGTDFLAAAVLLFDSQADSTLTFQNPIDMADAARTINVVSGTAVLTGGLNSTTPTSSLLTKSGVGALVLYGTNSFAGPTSVTAGELRIAGGAQLNSFGAANVAAGAGQTGTATISGVGSAWIASANLNIGSSGVGTLIVSDGGQVVTSLSAHIGFAAVGTGSATITGLGSMLSTSGHLIVSSSGAGSLLISDGGQVVTTSSGFIGNTAVGVGTVTVTGAASRWSLTGATSRLVIGNLGNGTLNVFSGGQVTTSNIGQIGLVAGATGTATIDGAGSHWTVGSDLNVGNNGTGFMFVQNGGQVTTTGSSVLGVNSGAIGMVTVSGTLSLWQNASTMAVGGAGTGTLNIQNEGQVIVSSTANLGNAGGGGTVNVTTSGIWSLTNSLRVGNGGTGVLHVQTGGRVTTGLHANFAFLAGSSGTATIDGVGSSLILGGNLVIGHTGVGVLNLQNGGHATVGGNASLGFGSTATGTATIDGAGSALVITSSLSIGQTGIGALYVQNGGSVVSRTGFLGVGAAATGSVTVSGNNSRWTVTEALYIGGTATAATGSGSVTLNDAGSLNVGTTLRLYSTGTLNLAGGSVTTQTLSITGATSNFVFTGGTLTLTGGLVADAGYVLTLGSGQTLVNHGRITHTIAVDGGALVGTGTQAGALDISSGSVTIQNGGVTTGTITIDAGTLTALSGAKVGNTAGIHVNGGTFDVQGGAQVLGNGQINVSGTLLADGDVEGLVVVTTGGTVHGTGSVGAIHVQDGGTLSVGHSVGTMTLDGAGLPGNAPSLQLDAGSTLVFEFNNATDTNGGWDKIELGAGTLTLNATGIGSSKINLRIDSLTLLGNVHGTADNFNAAPGTVGNVQEYHWKFIGMTDTNNIQTGGYGSLNGHFLIVDDLAGEGVFFNGTTTNGNPFQRPESHLGQGTFNVVAGNFGNQGEGLYIRYSAIPEPGSLILTSLGTLAAGWYGKRKRKKQADDATTMAEDEPRA